MFPSGVLWARRVVLYRKCVFCVHREMSAACLCVGVYSMRGMLLVSTKASDNVGHKGQHSGSGERGNIDKARQGSEDDPPSLIDLQSSQQLQVSAEGLARSFLSSFMGSGNSLYNSTSVSCLRALRAIVWKACSTLIASLALVSKYGMLFLL